MATTRLSVALLSLGLLLHCVSSEEGSPATDSPVVTAAAPVAPAATTTARPVITAPPTTTPVPPVITPSPTTTPVPPVTTASPTTTPVSTTITAALPATTAAPPAVPNTTTAAPPAVPNTTTAAPPAVPNTTTAAPPAVPNTTTAAPPAVPNTTTAAPPAVPNTTTAAPPAVPNTTTAAPPALPATTAAPPAAPSTPTAAVVHAAAPTVAGAAAPASPSPSHTSAHTTADHLRPTTPAVSTTNPAATNALPTSAGPPTTTSVSAPGGGQSAGTASKTPDPQDKTTSDNKVRTTLGAVTTVKTSPSGGVKTNTFSFPSSEKPEHEDQILVFALCRKLMGSLAEAECTVTWTQQGEDIQVQSCHINVTDTVANQYLADIRKEKLVSNPGDKTTLIAILASCGALLAMIIGLGIYATHHRKPYHENQQHLTEELHTVENGYHDNPTLEVMEVQPEMQEKKKPFCNEFDDSWIVPMETMAKEVLPEEEDTHL